MMMQWTMAALGLLLAAPALAAQAEPVPPPSVPSPPVPPRIERQADPARHYPARERRAGVGGIVLVGLGVRLDGAVTRCAVERPSGSPALDKAACALARDLRFAPAPEAVPQPAVEYGCCTRVEIVWTGGTARLRPLHGRGAYHPNMGRLFTNADYPASARQARQQGLVGFEAAIGADGRVTECSIAESSGFEALDQATCRILRERLVMATARNEQGEAVPATIRSRIIWRL